MHWLMSRTVDDFWLGETAVYTKDSQAISTGLYELHKDCGQNHCCDQGEGAINSRRNQKSECNQFSIFNLKTLLTRDKFVFMLSHLDISILLALTDFFLFFVFVPFSISSCSNFPHKEYPLFCFLCTSINQHGEGKQHGIT